MRIYPGTHNIRIKKQVGIGDIPLAYLYGNEKSSVAQIKIEKDFAKPSEKKPIQPYDAFQTNDMYWFDERKRPVSAFPYLRQEGNRYYARPTDIVSESAVHPSEQFAYRARIHKKDSFKKEVSYDVCVAAGDEDIAQKISALFCSKKPDGWPANITFNHGGQTLNSLFNRTADDTDFVFASKDDFDTIDAIEDMLEEHVNIWLFDDEFDDCFVGEDTPAFYELKEPHIFSDVSGTLEDYKRTIMVDPNQDDNEYDDETTEVIEDDDDDDDDDEEETGEEVELIEEEQYLHFSTEQPWSLLPDETYEYINLFDSAQPIQLILRKGGGYVVLAHSSMLEDLSEYANLILEIMMYIYLNGYYTTPARSSFVTDEPMNYYLNTNVHYGLCHPRISLPSLLYDCGFNPDITYEVDDVIFVTDGIRDPNASYTGVNRYQELQFKKISEPLNDRTKGNNILAYTKDKTLLLYKEEDSKLSTIESGVEIRVVDDVSIGVGPLQSSKYKISTTTEQIDINVPVTPGTYSLVYDRSDGRFKIPSVYSDLTHVKVAEIKVEDNHEIVFRDIRTPGGGEASAVPNYEMIDTGCLTGRPIRYGGILVIQLPSRYRGMKDIFMSEVSKHMTSGDYPILVFKD